MKVDFKLDEKNVYKRLENLGNKVQGKALIGVARSILNKVARGARSKVREETGLLKKAIQTDVKIYNKGATLFGLIGINRKVKGEGPDGKRRIPRFYAHIVEIRKPFLRPSWIAEEGKMQANFEKALGKRIDRELKKK